MSRLSTFLLSLVAAGLAFANPFVSPSQPHGILDFARPPNTLDVARLVVINGSNVNAPLSRTSFWVAPGEHTLVIAAAISGRDTVGLTPRRNRGTGSQEVTIQVEEGKRYRIAARLLDRRGNWEPVVWKIEDARD